MKQANSDRKEYVGVYKRKLELLAKKKTVLNSPPPSNHELIPIIISCLHMIKAYWMHLRSD